MTQLLQSVSQALKILQLLQRNAALGVSEVAKNLDVSSSTAHRLLVTLHEAGFVQQVRPGRKYQLGPAMQYSRYASTVARLVDVSGPVLVDLRDQTGETIHLAALSGTDTTFLSACESQHIMRVISRVGNLLPAHTTAAGKLLLSYLSDEELDSLYPDARLANGTATSLHSLAALKGELAAVRERGYGHNLAESEPGVAALAVPLIGPDAQFRFSLTVSGPDSRFNPDRSPGLSTREAELLTLLREAAARIQSQLHL